MSPTRSRTTPLYAHVAPPIVCPRCTPSQLSLPALPPLPPVPTSAPMRHLSPTPSTPSMSYSLLPPLSPASHSQPSSPTSPSIITHDLIPFILKKDQTLYNLLPLTPGVSPPRTSFDLILPEPEAFVEMGSPPMPVKYPPFTSRSCSWQAILGLVRQPARVWRYWAPGNLGTYSSFAALWQAWDEGEKVDGVGCKPALRLIEAQWGQNKSKHTNVGRLPAWRPTNDAKARKTWSNFKLMQQQVQSEIDNGKTPAEAIRILDARRGTLSLPQYHKKLQPRTRRQTTATAASSMSIIAPIPAIMTHPSL